MASLREIKDHIASVRSTLKITSAMKLVASAKLRKAQQAAEGIRPYTAALSQMLSQVLAYPSATGSTAGLSDPQAGLPAPPLAGDGPPPLHPWADRASGSDSPAADAALNGNIAKAAGSGEGRSVAIVAVASNSSLCGAFNINVIHRAQELIAECRKVGADVEVFSVGRKMAEAMRKAGYPSPGDYSDLVGHNSFEKSAAFAQTLIDGFNSGRYSRVLLVYNHFVSTSSQKVCVETYLPFAMSGGEELPTFGQEYILEPGREEILATLLPQVMRLRIHSMLLDSIAAEHAARTIAMQAASDNAEDLLGELTLEYNKGRQQKITAEILDLVGGAQQ